MKRAELFFTAILVPIDYLMFLAAGLSAYAIRFSNMYQEQIREVVFALRFAEYVSVVWKFAFTWLLFFALAGLYSVRPRGRVEEISKVFLACSAGVMAIVVFIFLQRELFASRFIVLAAWVLAIVYVSIARIVVRGFQIHQLRRGIGAHRALVVGGDETTKRLVDFFAVRPEMGVRVVHRFADADGGAFEEIGRLTRERAVDEIIQAESNLPKEQSLALISLAHDAHVDFRYAADMFASAVFTNIEVSTLAGVPIVEVKRTRLDGWGRIGKRAFDIIISLLGLIMLSPFLALIALVVRFTSPGPAVVVLTRVGARGEEFTVYKFRSMVVGADKMKAELERYNERNDGPLFKMSRDPRITTVGRFLRRFSLDELPQLWNVLKGEMSLVGPRPHEPEEVARYQQQHKHLLDVRPGITGMAQVAGRSDLNFEDEVKLDVYYIENWSMTLDVAILLRTPYVVVRGGARAF